MGTVESIGVVTADGTCGVAGATSNFTILRRNGTTDTVDVSASTSFREAGVASATFANVCVGDSAAAVGTTAGTTVSATKVRIEWPRASGAVSSVNGSSTAGSCGTSGATGIFTVMGWKKSATSWTVDVGSGATFYERGVTAPSFANVCVGDEATAVGQLSGTDTITASTVAVMTPRVMGSVASVNGAATTGSCGSAGSSGAFTLSARTGTAWTVDVTSTTTFTEASATSPSFANVCVSGRVAVLGTISGTTVTADSVMVGWGTAHHPHPTTGLHAKDNHAAGGSSNGTKASSDNQIKTAGDSSSPNSHTPSGDPGQNQGGIGGRGSGHGGDQGHHNDGGQGNGGGGQPGH